MARGRKPKSTVVKLLQGNAGKRKINKNEPQYSKMDVTCPPHLTPLAKEEWARLYPEMTAQGMLTTADRAPFAAYCQSYARWVKAEEKLSEMMEKSDDSLFGGMIFKTNKNNLSQNPLIRIADRAMENMVRTGSEFGLTPSSRSRAGKGTTSSDYGDGYDPSAGNW